MQALGRRRSGAQSAAPVVPERGRATRPLSFFFLALTLALAGVFSSPSFTIGDITEVFLAGSAMHAAEHGISPASGEGASVGATGSLEGKAMKTPPCLSEARARQECN